MYFQITDSLLPGEEPDIFSRTGMSGVTQIYGVHVRMHAESEMDALLIEEHIMPHLYRHSKFNMIDDESKSNIVTMEFIKEIGHHQFDSVAFYRFLTQGTRFSRRASSPPLWCVLVENDGVGLMHKLYTKGVISAIYDGYDKLTTGHVYFDNTDMNAYFVMFSRFYTFQSSPRQYRANLERFKAVVRLDKIDALLSTGTE
jgi:hypothetical protein